jgi:hypothetical protein
MRSPIRTAVDRTVGLDAVLLVLLSPFLSNITDLVQLVAFYSYLADSWVNSCSCAGAPIYANPANYS